jgi:hypothetical protein
VVGVVKFSEPEACTEGQDKDESDSNDEFDILGKSGPLILADPWFRASGNGVKCCGIGDGNPEWSCENGLFLLVLRMCGFQCSYLKSCRGFCLKGNIHSFIRDLTAEELQGVSCHFRLLA